MLPAYTAERGFEVGVILEVLEALDKAGVASPGDVVIATGKPRYLVLSALKLLEELGLVEPIYSRGTHRIYRVSRLGYLVMEVGLDGLRKILEDALDTVEGPANGMESPIEAIDGRSRGAPEGNVAEASQEA
jgi:DNA-binding transcriptional ArsR family regulator